MSFLHELECFPKALLMHEFLWCLFSPERLPSDVELVKVGCRRCAGDQLVNLRTDVAIHHEILELADVRLAAFNRALSLGDTATESDNVVLDIGDGGHFKDLEDAHDVLLAARTDSAV